MERTKFWPGTVAMGLSLLALSSSLRANITPFGNVEPDISGWDHNADVYVGRIADGSILVQGHDRLVSGETYLGFSPGTTGTSTVTGTGSEWDSRILYVGYEGVGQVTIDSDGECNSLSANLGYRARATGTVLVTGAGSRWVNSQLLFVGFKGQGNLIIDAGGHVDSEQGILGATPGSSGSAIVTDTSSQWNTPVLTVGEEGTGVLTVESGAHVTTTAGQVGYTAGSSGTVTVSGAGSSWTSSKQFGIGYKGTGDLTIQDGADLITGGANNIGYMPGAVGTVHITGAGSRWNNAGNLYLGFRGSGMLTVEAGAEVDNASALLGSVSGSLGKVTVTGAGSRWTSSNSLYVGREGEGTLAVDDGGEVIAGNLYASPDELKGDGTITVDGAVLDGNLIFDSANGIQTSLPFGSGGILTVRANGRDLGAGYKGVGAVTIAGGVAINSRVGNLGYAPGSTGSATVGGTGSSWNVSHGLYVGRDGEGTLMVTDGGHVSAKTLYAALDDIHGDGMIEVNGAVLDGNFSFDASSKSQAIVPFGSGGSLKVSADSDILGAGYKGAGTLTISHGADVASNSGILGYHQGSSGTAKVTGAGTHWENSALFVGREGYGSLVIDSGAQVSSHGSRIGATSGSSGAAVVTGTGSQWSSSWLEVGFEGAGNLITQLGGEITSDFVELGYASGSVGIATVTDAGSKWNVTGSLMIGSNQNGNGIMNIRNGGKIYADTVYLQDQSLLSIDVGNGSLLSVDGRTRRLFYYGLIRLAAGPTAIAASRHTPIAAGQLLGTGAIQTLGGTWNDMDRVFTVSDMVTGTSETPIGLDLSQQQRVLVEDSESGNDLVVNFLAKPGPAAILSFAATVLAADFPDRTALQAWEVSFAGQGYAVGDPVYLSMGIDSGLLNQGVQVWHDKGAGWERYPADDLTINAEGYASFTITAPGRYAIAVPEPSTCVLALLLLKLVPQTLLYSRRR